MKPLLLAVGFAALVLRAAPPAAGRWDLTVTTPNAQFPSWLELTANNGEPQARVQGRSGSVHPVKNVKVDGDHISFTEPVGRQGEVIWDLTYANDQLTGTQKRPDGSEPKVAGVRAPALDRTAPSHWSKAAPIFNTKDLTGWEPDNPAKNGWKVIDGDLVNETAGANLRTTRKFEDFKLHIEFNCPELGNSGVYLRGRYEIQVEYEKPGTEDPFHSMGSIYGFLAPSSELPRKPGQWESFDVTLVGRRVTISRNGVLVIDNQEIPGITGGAIDSHEAEPGPIYLQGDHTGGMKYRNITISLPAGR
ncbi:MAG: DUF1080 domain-containing protein [Acidobacteriaceae bacterium]|nr:DUF1080 domain-containing protein [Acidobacteriaceae bacterium]